MLPLYKGNRDFNQPQPPSPGRCLVRPATVREPGPTPETGVARKLGEVAGSVGPDRSQRAWDLGPFLKKERDGETERGRKAGEEEEKEKEKEEEKQGHLSS